MDLTAKHIVLAFISTWKISSNNEIIADKLNFIPLIYEQGLKVLTNNPLTFHYKAIRCFMLALRS